MPDFDPLTVLFYVATLVPALVLHEVAHGIVADRMGDHTPRLMGRLTLNPVKHVDPFGTVILPGLLLLPYLFGRGSTLVFAYAKPMPIDTSNLRNPDRQMVTIALAGPITNVLLAVAGGLILRLVAPGLGPALREFGVLAVPLVADQVGVLAGFLCVFVMLNVILAVFNIMPIPPLDGSKVLAIFLPPRAREVYRSWEPYGALFMLVVFLLFPGALFAIVGPVADGLLLLLVG